MVAVFNVVGGGWRVEKEKTSLKVGMCAVARSGKIGTRSLTRHAFAYVIVEVEALEASGRGIPDLRS